MRFLPFLFAFFISVVLAGQERFNEELLEDSKRNGKRIENSIPKKEIVEYKAADKPNVFHLKNGLRSSKYINAFAWGSLRKTVEVNKVEIIFSKYPIRKSGYHMNHQLLFNRLKNLFKIDPFLNDSSIQFEIVLQTNCINDNQVDGLYHGIAIHYETDSPAFLTPEAKKVVVPDPHSAAMLLDRIESFTELPNEVKKELKAADEIEKTEILVKYFEKIVSEEELSKKDSIFLNEKRLLIDRFIATYSASPDSIVYKVFDRNPQWKDALVVADWTGSMYQYGAQALLWHILNFKQSGLTYFTLFNDGDKRGSKPIGKTKGIYHEKADNIEKVIALYQLVQLKGGGGDTPENDLEGIIRGIEKNPVHSEVILIADNNACVRDMSLLEFITEPVKVIVCGAQGMKGLNPQYLEIARQTGGSIHTIDLDIYNLDVAINKKGEPINFLDVNLKIGTPPCFDKEQFYVVNYFNKKIISNLDSAKAQRKYVVNLDLSDQGYSKAPWQIKKMKQLKNLNLSNNSIRKITKAIYKTNLESLDLSYNEIETVPEKLGLLGNLKHLKLNSNRLDTFPLLRSPNLKNLISLDLSDNNLRGLTPYFNCRYLKTLLLDNNEITELSRGFFKSRKLEELTLSNNNISELPRQLGHFKRLKVLDLSNNNLTELPTSILRLKKLERLVLNGNNLESKVIQNLREKMPNTLIEFQ